MIKTGNRKGSTVKMHEWSECLEGLKDTPGRVRLVTLGSQNPEEVFQTMSEQGISPITPRDLAYVQMNYGPKDFKGEVVGSAALIVSPGKGKYLLRRAPWEDEAFCKQIAAEFKEERFTPYNEQGLALRVIKEQDSLFQDKSVLHLKGSIHQKRIPCEEFGNEPITQFMFQDLAEAYGQWAIKSARVNSMPFDLESGDERGKKPYASGLMFIPPTRWEREIIQDDTYRILGTLRAN